jgi:hypothetical protein
MYTCSCKPPNAPKAPNAGHVNDAPSTIASSIGDGASDYAYVVLNDSETHWRDPLAIEEYEEYEEEEEHHSLMPYGQAWERENLGRQVRVRA